MKNPDTIYIVNFGGQYCHLLARRVREQNVYSEIVNPNSIPSELPANVKGIILSGGPSSVYCENAPQISSKLLYKGIPILGLCYGHQLIAHQLGGKIKRSNKMEYGVAEVTIKKPVGLLKGLKKSIKVWMSHGDSVVSLPPDFEVLAHTKNCPVSAFKHKTYKLYGLQWHPEVVHTEYGDKMLSNFIFDICNCKANWKLEDFITRSVNELKAEIGNRKAILAISGGIDSSVAGALGAKALGNNLTTVFVDHGFMRKDEAEEVAKVIKKLKVNFIKVNAEERFLSAVKGVVDPEKKRKIIGEQFIRVFEEEAKKVNADYLLQGTIYPDRIESGSSQNSAVIKTHHNVGGIPLNVKFKKIVEPLKELYKDEVRRVGKKLKLPPFIINRQPFPGPGLAVRIIGDITKERLELLREADAIVRYELDRSKLNLWQYFAVLTNTYTTGVKGDSRAYGYTIAIRAVDSREAMTAKFVDIPYEILERMSTRITNELTGVNRVVYDITHKPPATIEWE
ncbi:MAG: glutamine-hydrolyzing GMP synthase [bacterium]|nr:glutamine-hydrolyzing GMP synthase [bacterium]